MLIVNTYFCYEMYSKYLILLLHHIQIKTLCFDFWTRILQCVKFMIID